MSLNTYHTYWVPDELLLVIAKYLPLRSRRCLVCVTKGHNRVLNTWKDKTYGGIWFTEEQEELLRETLSETTGIVHLKAPPSAGKTSIALAAALGTGGFVPPDGLLFIAVMASLVGVWTKEISKMFPSLKVLKVCSGGVSYREGYERLKRGGKYNKYNYNVVITTPV